MKQTIIRKDKLLIKGLTGDGAKTGELWGAFTELYDQRPFGKADEHGYEIRYWDGEQPVPAGRDVHVGFLAETAGETEGFSVLILPASEYVVFDVLVADGYDSGDAAME